MQLFVVGRSHNFMVFSGFLLIVSFLVLLSSNSYAECYEYDDLGRLITVKYDNNTTKRSYNLDKHGNRVGVNVDTAANVSCVAPVWEPSNGDINVSPDYNQVSSIVTDTEHVSLAINSTITVTPLDGDSGGVGLSLDSIANTSGLLAATKVGNEVTLTSNSTAGAATISYNVSDNSGNFATGMIVVTISADLSTSTDPCINNWYAQECGGETQ